MSAVSTSFRAPLPVRAAALTLAAGLLLSGCGASKPVAKPSPSPTPTPQRVVTGLQLQGEWPLTGLAAHGAAPKRPVLVVKMDNTESSRPQIGLSRADMVVEELVEGGLTRLAVFYYTHLPQVAGPVRSMRASDINFVKPARATIITSGAAPLTYGRLRAAGIHWIENRDDAASAAEGFVRDGARIAPYNLLIHTARLVHRLHTPKHLPESYLNWGPGYAGRGRALSITAQFSGFHTSLWHYQHGHYVNTNSNAGSPFPATTLLVLRVREGDAGYLDPAGHHVPETKLIGSGSAVLFHGGKVLHCTWSKPGPARTIRLHQGSTTITVPAGHTWIELLPVGSAGGSLSFH